MTKRERGTSDATSARQRVGGCASDDHPSPPAGPGRLPADPAAGHRLPAVRGVSARGPAGRGGGRYGQGRSVHDPGQGVRRGEAAAPPAPRGPGLHGHLRRLLHRPGRGVRPGQARGVPARRGRRAARGDAALPLGQVRRVRPPGHRARAYQPGLRAPGRRSPALSGFPAVTTMTRQAARAAMTSASQTWWKASTGCTAAVPRMTTTTATPIALPTWRAIVSTALPVVARSGGRVPAAANSGAWTSPAEIPPANSPGRNAAG